MDANTPASPPLPISYIGQKRIEATPGEGASGAQGYRVRYEDGYESWSPKAVFEDAYQPLNRMDFAGALYLLKRGFRVAREGWNGKGMFLYLVPGSKFTVNRPPLLGIYPEGTPIDYLAHIDMKTADGSCVPWLASQTDVLANDWTVLVGSS